MANIRALVTRFAAALTRLFELRDPADWKVLARSKLSPRAREILRRTRRARAELDAMIASIEPDT